MFVDGFDKGPSVRTVLDLFHENGLLGPFLDLPSVADHEFIELLHPRTELLYLMLSGFTTEVLIHEHTEVAYGLLELSYRAFGDLLNIDAGPTG